MRRNRLVIIGVILLVLTLTDASGLAPQRPAPRLLAHRGVHQTFSMEGIDGETCTDGQGAPEEHTLAQVPADFGGWIWTNKVEDLGPALSVGR